MAMKRKYYRVGFGAAQHAELAAKQTLALANRRREDFAERGHCELR